MATPTNETTPSVPASEPPLEAGPGASDESNGGGPGAGLPDGDALLRDGDPIAGSDKARDREKLFPDELGNRGHRGQ